MNLEKNAINGKVVLQMGGLNTDFYHFFVCIKHADVRLYTQYFGHLIIMSVFVSIYYA